MINLVNYKTEVRRYIQKYLDLITVWDNPNDYAWLVYSLYNGNDPFLSSSFDILLEWASSENAWKKQRNFGPLALVIWLSHKLGISIGEKIESEFETRLASMFSRPITKFSILNYPDQLFFISLALGSMNSSSARDLKTELSTRVFEFMKFGGSVQRIVLLSAAYLELIPDSKETLEENFLEKWHLRELDFDPPGLISLIWLSERYNMLLGIRADLWDYFSEIKPILVPNIEFNEELVGTRYLAPIDISLLYEALVYETRQPDPNLLFDLYPLHPRIRSTSEELFKLGKYALAVFEAAKAFDRYVQKLTNAKDKNGKDLYGYALFDKIMNPGRTLGDKDPLIKFNALRTTTEFSEQSGIWHLALGAHLAFRNPKGHELSDDLEIDPYEALDQLVLISYLFKRVENAYEVNRDKNP